MDTLKAADLNRHHLGRTVRVSQGTSQFTDTLSGVSHEANVIEERRFCDEVPSYLLGRIITTLTFALAGSVQISGSADVEVGEQVSRGRDE